MRVTREASRVSTEGPETPQALFGKLSPGPGRSAAEVAEHQRWRLYTAMIKVVGEDGYQAVTVRKVARLAGVSTRAFYEHFEGKEECFLRTFELIVRRAATRIEASLGTEADWRDRLHGAIGAFVHAVVRKPCPARLALIEASGAGAAAVERIRAAETLFEAMLIESFIGAPGEFKLPPLLVKGVVSGVCGVVRTRLIAGRERELPGMVDELVDWVMSFQGEATVEIEKLDLRRTPLDSAVPPRFSPTLQRNGRPIEDDRPIILAAVAKLAASKSYYQLTVPRIRDAAGVSLRSFETHFDNAEDCFLAALEFRVSAALEHAAGQAEGDDWAGDVYLTLEALCGKLATDPVLYAVALSEAFMTGPSGVRCRAGMMVAIAERLCASAPPGQGLGQVAAEASAGAVWAVLHHCVMTGKARQRLPRLPATLAYLILAPATRAGTVETLPSHSWT